MITTNLCNKIFPCYGLMWSTQKIKTHFTHFQIWDIYEQYFRKSQYHKQETQSNGSHKINTMRTL
ncbi:unnamed protein product [Paramecium octaurelia]|uniref:Uncharacterized protein n=1 Tax=Paramecium octaurelia TaxID=43137 RepID=A0A8S1VCQ5_PAROT|nr:unnamed protein product [Paramecium octaurelia]